MKTFWIIFFTCASLIMGYLFYIQYEKIPPIYTMRPGEYLNIHISPSTTAQLAYLGIRGEEFGFSKTWNKFGRLQETWYPIELNKFHRQYASDIIEFKVLELTRDYIKFQPIY
jgi:hypothetical protein